MADERYIRWQGQGIAQMSVAIALISGLSVAGMSLGLSLLQDAKFLEATPYKGALGVSLLMFFAAAFLSFGAVISRLLDFRLTARQVRKRANPAYDKPMRIFRLDSEGFGRATWRLFWLSCTSLIVGSTSIAISVGSAYVGSVF